MTVLWDVIRNGKVVGQINALTYSEACPMAGSCTAAAAVRPLRCDPSHAHRDRPRSSAGRTKPALDRLLLT